MWSSINRLIGGTPRLATDAKSSLKEAEYKTSTQVVERKQAVGDVARESASHNEFISRNDLVWLARFHWDRSENHEDSSDLEKTIEYMARALELPANDDLDVSSEHYILGAAYLYRFRNLDQLDDLEKAIEHQLRAIAFTPDDHPELPRRHAILGVSYCDRYLNQGLLNDLEKAVEHKLCAIKLAPDCHPELPDWHANLSVSYRDRFRHLSEPCDLDKAIEHDILALALTPEGHPDLPCRHSNLTTSYGDRYRHLGALGDLEKKIEHQLHALKLTPDGHTELSTRYDSLGGSYDLRFRLLGELGDLEKAIEHIFHAIVLTPDNYPELSSRHDSLAACYIDRFECLDELDDLEKSIKHGLQALELTPDGHQDLSSRHSNLGLSYTHRFRRLGEVNDLEKAVEHQSRAFALTPDEDPQLPQQYFNQAQTSFLQYQHTSDPSHLNNSLSSFREASQLSTGSVAATFWFALRWAVLATDHSCLNPIEAFQTAIDLCPRFIQLGATANQRYQNLQMANDFATSAASAAILHSNYKLALEWLEHVRCVVWNQCLMISSPPNQRNSAYPELATRLQELIERLRYTTSEAREPRAFASIAVKTKQLTEHYHHLAKEYNDLLHHVHQFPRFNDCPKPMNSNRLVASARYGPIVLINCHYDRCDALIIVPGQDSVDHLPLPNFTTEKARQARSELKTSLKRKDIRERGSKLRRKPESNDNFAKVLLTLWKDIVKPVLDFLDYTTNVSANDLPHITWCPTDVLSFLPLHAAGDYTQPHSRAFNYVISSYTPSLTALLTSVPSSLHSTSRVLAISQESIPGLSSLPGAAKELACLEARALNRFGYSQLTGNRATTAAVLNAMEQHDWVHLACHASQNVDDPTKSGFHLHDGTLDITSINRRPFKKKGLAFLSAFQAVTGDENLPDEAMHLASGMLMAGYPSVIATMWSVVGRDAPFVSDKVYAELLTDGKVGNGEAGKALHYATGALREKVGENEFARWVPYIHIGS